MLNVAKHKMALMMFLFFDPSANSLTYKFSSLNKTLIFLLNVWKFKNHDNHAFSTLKSSI